MDKYTGQGIIEYFDRFKTDLDCLAYLSNIKWSQGFTCVKCNHTKFTVRKINLARDCNRCHHIESPTAGTMFHKVKFGIRKAFTIVFEMSATTKSISSSQMAKRLNIRYNYNCSGHWKVSATFHSYPYFMHKKPSCVVSYV